MIFVDRPECDCLHTWSPAVCFQSTWTSSFQLTSVWATLLAHPLTCSAGWLHSFGIYSSLFCSLRAVGFLLSGLTFPATFWVLAPSALDSTLCAMSMVEVSGSRSSFSQHRGAGKPWTSDIWPSLQGKCQNSEFAFGSFSPATHKWLLPPFSRNPQSAFHSLPSCLLPNFLPQ